MRAQGGQLKVLPGLIGQGNSGRILTTDMRDFGAHRWKQRTPFHNLLTSP